MGGRGQIRVGGGSGAAAELRAPGREGGYLWELWDSQSGSKVGFGSHGTPISDGFGKTGHSWKKAVSRFGLVKRQIDETSDLRN